MTVAKNVNCRLPLISGILISLAVSGCHTVDDPPKRAAWNAKIWLSLSGRTAVRKGNTGDPSVALFNRSSFVLSLSDKEKEEYAEQILLIIDQASAPKELFLIPPSIVWVGKEQTYIAYRSNEYHQLKPSKFIVIKLSEKQTRIIDCEIPPASIFDGKGAIAGNVLTAEIVSADGTCTAKQYILPE